MKPIQGECQECKKLQAKLDRLLQAARAVVDAEFFMDEEASRSELEQLLDELGEGNHNAS